MANDEFDNLTANAQADADDNYDDDEFFDIDVPEDEDDLDDDFDAFAGTFDVEVFEVKRKIAGDTAKNPGAPYIALTLKVIDDSERKGRRIWTNIMLKGDTSVSRRYLRALGVDYANGIAAADLLGKQATARVAVKRQAGYDDKTEVKRLTPIKAAPASDAVQ